MALFIKGDIVFAEDIHDFMKVTNVSGEKVFCDNKEFDETDINLFSRPGVTAKVIETCGKEICKVYWNVDSDSQRRMGALFRYQEHDWVVYKEDVYCAQLCGDESYNLFAGEEILNAQTEEWIIQ